MVTFDSFAELQAEKAENLPAFSGIKLRHIKQQLVHILGQIGRDGIFDEYTKHDISHIDYVLRSLDWLIPESTKSSMVAGDWLMIVLSIYFHDLGMLVTKDEYNARASSQFPVFKRSIFEGVHGSEYRDKVANLEPDRQDRFIYQELVRKTHAERIKYWILNEKDPYLNSASTIADQIQKLIGVLDYKFRRDLATICESHHLSDLDNFEKYRISQPYGPSANEVVNLHYSALILRTADLLHVTSDRTPSIEYAIINPSDPISQEEWAKQRAVNTVRPKQKRDKEGKLDESLPKDSLEVHAFFADEKGFFGLISYLDYANQQLAANARLNEIAKKIHGSKYDFPWKSIDDSNIETKDFEKKQFEFSLDQPRILNLLVGHTLYNDQTVVLRELIQNSIDATKLYKHQVSNSNNSYEPTININWAEKERILSFIDNGTGMNLDIIQNHLLKVGSSRYQDEEFKKKFPDFSPISRFGIGLLTGFLIADNIDIVTREAESDKAILLKINKVHGKYLLKYLSVSEVNKLSREHGTEIKLYVRSDVNMQNIEADIRKWVLLSYCKIVLNKNGEEVKIGDASPKVALENYLAKRGYEIAENKIKVVEYFQENLSLAVALRYVEHFQEWEFLEFSPTADEEYPPIGTCVEGIRVDFNTPGFLNRTIFTLVNAVGKNAPKTNVARSNIEVTPEKEGALYVIYKMYLEQLASELSNLIQKGYSLSWAVKEFNWLLNSFANYNRHNGYGLGEVFENKKVFERALAEVDCILIEQNDKRELSSINRLKEIGSFWTIDSASYSSADSLIKEVRTTGVSALSLLKSVHAKGEAKLNHIDVLLCSFVDHRIVDSIISEQFQVEGINIVPEQRRLDLNWKLTKESKWEYFKVTDDEARYNNVEHCYVQMNEMGFEKEIGYSAINLSRGMYILRNSPISDFLVDLTLKMRNRSREEEFALETAVRIVYQCYLLPYIDRKHIGNIVDSFVSNVNFRGVGSNIWQYLDKRTIISLIANNDFTLFDSTVWDRRRGYYAYID